MKIEKINNRIEACLVYIDESHNLLNNTNRSFKLSEIVYLLKKMNDVVIRYYSPVISKADSVLIKGLYDRKIKTVNKIRDLKVYRYFIYNKGVKKNIYTRHKNNDG